MEQTTISIWTKIGRSFLTIFLLPIWPYFFFIGIHIGQKMVKKQDQDNIIFTNKERLEFLKQEAKIIFPMWARYTMSALSWAILIKYLLLS